MIKNHELEQLVRELGDQIEELETYKEMRACKNGRTNEMEMKNLPKYQDSSKAKSI